MLRAMLAERFRLLAHRERREMPSFDLVAARSDGKLGPGLVASSDDCDGAGRARRAAAEAARRTVLRHRRHRASIPTLLRRA